MYRRNSRPAKSLASYSHCHAGQLRLVNAKSITGKKLLAAALPLAYNPQQILWRDTSTKILVDYNRCESNARCMQVAPDIFEVRDDDKLYVLDEHPPESARERVMKAVRVCPKQALSVVENH